MKRSYLTKISLILMSFAVVGIVVSPSFASHEHDNGNELSSATNKTQLLMPAMNVEFGRKLFVSKGCVACHAVNGVGGHDAPAMDDYAKLGLINPFDFVAKMWNHAPGMLAAQEEAFGEPVTFTGEEISNIIAFVHDGKALHSFSDKDLTKEARKMMKHGHGETKAPNTPAKEAGHGHGRGSKPHKD